MDARDLDIIPIEEAYDHLAKSIVIQAIDDYRRILNHQPFIRGGSYQKNKKEIEKFFLSEWFIQLCDWDGKTLMELLKEQEGYQDG